jgi:2-amino-4-hydroxy-6-hydroxymethyldihydropteridine diphosphokinase
MSTASERAPERGDGTDGRAEDVFLGLGANVGDALATLAAAVHALDDLDGVAVVDTSGVYRTAPWPPPGDPRAVAQDDYLNLVVRAACRLAPAELLAEVQLLERAFGRDRGSEQRWGPRPLDIDVLLFGDRQVDIATSAGRLQIPHPRLAERAFVLVPLLEVHPGGALPDGRRLTHLLMALGPLEGIELEVRLDEVPSLQVPRPQGPAGGPPTFARHGDDEVAREHGAR